MPSSNLKMNMLQRFLKYKRISNNSILKAEGDLWELKSQVVGVGELNHMEIKSEITKQAIIVDKKVSI